LFRASRLKKRFGDCFYSKRANSASIPIAIERLMILSLVLYVLLFLL
jgi:hypothetical protein